MGIAQFPAVSASSKTRFQTTLTSGTSYTVPTGVNYLVVTTVGGGGGGGVWANSSGNVNNGGAGGTTNFTGATAAGGGSGGSSYTTANDGASQNIILVGKSGAAGSGGSGGTGKGAQNASGIPYSAMSQDSKGGDGEIRTSIVNTSPGASINYSIGAGGSAGNSNSVTNLVGGVGGSGRIEIEYWAQVINMEKLFAVIENNKVVNIVVGVEDEVVIANPGKYIEYTNGWDYNNGIDTENFFGTETIAVQQEI